MSRYPVYTILPTRQGAEGRTWRVSFEEFEAYPRRWSEQPPRQREEERRKGSGGGGGGGEGSSEQGPRFVRRDGNKEFIFGSHMRGLFRQSVAVTLQIEIEPPSVQTYFSMPPSFFLFFFFSSVILHTRVDPRIKKMTARSPVTLIATCLPV